MQTWIAGRLVDADRATVPANDHGIVVGDGVFETLKVTGGVAFALTRHLDRLRASAEALDLVLPADATLRSAVADVLAANSGELGEGPARLRITVTAGPGPYASARGEGPPTVIVATAPLARRRPSTSVVVVPWTRNERGALAGVKSTSYADNVRALRYAEQRGGDEAIFANTAGRLCEGTGSNVFLGIGGRLVTPPLADGCLAGVTRALLLEWTGAVEASLAVDALRDADEVFLSSTTREVQPVGAVDGRRLPAVPGPLTRRAAAIFAERAAADADP